MADNKQYITQNQDNGCVMISEDVICSIVSHAVSEVDGVVSINTKPAAELADMIAVGESTPGPIAINAATFVGFRTCGFRGAFCATVGVILPSFITIFCISFILKEFQNARLVQQAFFGIRAAVLALIIKALWSMYKQCAKNTVSYILMAAAFVLTAFSGVNVLWVIIGCALFGLIASTIAARRGKNDIS